MYPPRLPEPPPPEPNDTAILYGARILQWLIAEQVYCTCPDEALRQAEHAAHFAVTAPGILPIAVDRISDARHEIARTLSRRAELARQDTQLDAPPARHEAPPVPGGSVPRRPYPTTQPPAGAYADPVTIDF